MFIKIVSPGPVLFAQERVGYLGRPFTMWKFRTMEVDANTCLHEKHLCNLIRSNKVLIKLDEEEDSRIMPFGRLLRETGLDELPQLLNVIRGEMSLVGPRPCIFYEARECLPWQRKRFNVVPGLTGLWQVTGKNTTTYKEMMGLDIKYSQERSFWLDLVIITKTFPAVIKQSSNSFLRKQVTETSFEKGEEEYARGN
jgi:lipopolysaccharide/colanic/teichoic acid biosynthesis glycosyltransferase